MYKPALVKLFSVGCGALLSLEVSAASVHGTLTFDKRAPFAAVAYIPGAASDNSSAPVRAEIDQIDKTFTTSIAVNAPGQAVTFKNSDSMDHNVYANDIKQKAKFDVGLMPPGGVREVESAWQSEGLVRIGCKIHPKMRAYIASINSEHFTVIDMDKSTSTYTFTLENVPADSRTFKLLIPGYDTIELELGTSSGVPIEVSKRGKRRGQLSLTTEGMK